MTASAIDSIKDTSKLQKDIDQLGKWARKWGMRFQPVKRNIMQLTRKRIKKIKKKNHTISSLTEVFSNNCFLYGKPFKCAPNLPHKSPLTAF